MRQHTIAALILCGTLLAVSTPTAATAITELRTRKGATFKDVLMRQWASGSTVTACVTSRNSFRATCSVELENVIVVCSNGSAWKFEHIEGTTLEGSVSNCDIVHVCIKCGNNGSNQCPAHWGCGECILDVNRNQCTGPGATPQPTQGACADTDTNLCQQYKAWGRCSEYQYARHCPDTCNACIARCEDFDTHSCQIYKDRGLCHDPRWQKFCPKSCDSCSSPTPSPTTAPTPSPVPMTPAPTTPVPTTPVPTTPVPTTPVPTTPVPTTPVPTTPVPATPVPTTPVPTTPVPTTPAPTTPAPTPTPEKTSKPTKPDKPDETPSPTVSPTEQPTPQPTEQPTEQPTVSPTPEATPTPTEQQGAECPELPVEICLAGDMFTKREAEGWMRTQLIIRKVLGSVQDNFPDSSVRVAGLIFGTNVYWFTGFTPFVDRIVEFFQFAAYRSGGSQIEEALARCKKLFANEDAKRVEEKKRVVWLITDGNGRDRDGSSLPFSRIVAQANAVKNRGASIYVLGVGDEGKEPQLKKISGAPDSSVPLFDPIEKLSNQNSFDKYARKLVHC